MAALQAGGLLARRYRLIDTIGAGGMSVIWRARDEVLDRVVAVKVLAASLAADPKFREMVREEARAAAQLVHPHVTSVHDYGETLGPDGEIIAFVVMELLTGEELKARLTAGPLPWPAAVEVCAQVAEALAAAHRLGIVHRDITPANIMMTATGAKVLDFGIATHVGAPDEDEDGETFGTPAYVAPERLDGLPAQPATDTYSLGVLLYETLTGRVPFPADTWDELTRALESGAEPTLADVPDLPAAVADVCLRCLARDPAARPTAAQVGETLRAQLLSVGPQRVPPPGGVLRPPDAPPAAGTAVAPAVAPGTMPTESMESVTPVQPPAATPPPSGPVPEPRQSDPVGASPAESAVGAPDPGPANRPPRSVRGPVPQHPGRVLIATAATLFALIAVVIAAATPGGWPRPTPTSGASAGAGPMPSRAPSDAPRPSTASTAPAPTTATPPHRPAPATPSVSEAMANLDQIIADGLADSGIRDHAGVDLRNHLRNLRTGWNAESADLAGRVTQLGDKVATRVSEGSITPEYAQLLDAALVELAGAV
ncbi:serine/threonine protein kinase [Micromonospora sp. HM5-17]|uniref:serine/threonine protein kinase n=1 Tax=Micromonospora sp. HM5-17 TaxID=2487710 RepID=UPI000F493123|nr:serine/threonine protein kinase [Micromonospora sp. HM5-17]ROT32276.1 serine/threonine protein kinase [Micromonospora sp. HM5-17]